MATNVSLNTTVSISLAVGDDCFIESSGGYATVTVTPAYQRSDVWKVGPSQWKCRYGPYPRRTTVQIANSNATIWYTTTVDTVGGAPTGSQIVTALDAELGNPDWRTNNGGGGSGDMILASAQTVTGAKTFGNAGDVGKLKVAGTTSGATTIAAPAVAGTAVVTLPDATTTIVGRSTTDTLTNKTIDNPVLSGTLTGTYTIGGTPTFPAAVATLTGAQTLTNKTLTAATLTTPALGTPASGNLANCTAVPAAQISGVIPIANLATGTPTGSKFIRDDGTLQAIAGGGDALVANPLSQFAATTSAQLAGIISNETGTGSLVFATSPTLVTPALGTPASGVLTNCTGLPAAQISGVIPIANLATGTPTGSKFIRDDGTLQAIAGGGDALVANPLSQFAATTSAQLAGVVSDETGTGALVFANTPTLVTPALGAATGTSVTLTGAATAAGFVPTGATAVSDGMYLRAASTLGWSVGSAAKLKLSGTALAPSSDNGLALGESASRFSTVYAASISDGAEQLVGSSGTTARFGGGSGWTALSLFVGGTARLQIDSSGVVSVGGLTATGITTYAGATITTANAMGALAIDVTKGLNTKSVAADSTFTFSGTPATANTWFQLVVTNTDTNPHILTFPSAFSLITQAARTTCPIPASGRLNIVFRYNGSTYEVFGDGPYLNNTAATAAPAVTDDIAKGYGPGSLWFDGTGNAAYWCESNGAGAAVWNTLGGGSGDMVLASTQTVTGAKSFNDSTLKLNGSTSGTATLKTQATAGTVTHTLPTIGETLGYCGIPQVSQSAAYTCIWGDAGRHILHPSADTTARTFTIPANSSVAYPIGSTLTFINQNAGGVITIAITTDTMRLAGAGTTGSRTLAANGIATATKITSTEWIVSGVGLT